MQISAKFHGMLLISSQAKFLNIFQNSAGCRKLWDLLPCFRLPYGFLVLKSPAHPLSSNFSALYHLFHVCHGLQFYLLPSTFSCVIFCQARKRAERNWFDNWLLPFVHATVIFSKCVHFGLFMFAFHVYTYIILCINISVCLYQLPCVTRLWCNSSFIVIF